MKRWRSRILMGAALVAIAALVYCESQTRVLRGWWYGEPFFDGRPASFWADEIELWETQQPAWDRQIYVRRPAWPKWFERLLPVPTWPQLLDGDPTGLAVLMALREHSSQNVQDWAQIGIDRLSNDERGPIKLKHPSVIVIASLYEVEQALYDEIAKGKWLSTVDLEQLERKFFEGVPQGGQTPLDLLDLQKPLQPAKEIKLDLRKEGTLLAATTQTTCGPSPAQLRKGIQSRQTLEEGMRLLANADISVDRRHLRIAFIEKISSFEGIDKVTVLLDNAGTTVVGEVAAFKETSFTTPRNLPEGATLWLPLQHRSDNAKKSQRRWVARIVARIYVEAEERQILKAAGK